jgi:hypothetical protein
MGILPKDVLTFMTISRQIILRMRNVLDKSFRENQNTHSITFFETPAVYEIILKIMVESEGPQMTSHYGTYDLHAG